MIGKTVLDSLLIKNFRSLEHLQAPKLGRVNLIVGKNNTGKSSVLEALVLYATNAQRPVLEAIAREHDERYASREAEMFEEQANMPFQDFFSGRVFPATDDVAIVIGSLSNDQDRLQIQHALQEEKLELEEIRRRIVPKSHAGEFTGELNQVLLVKRGGRLISQTRLVNIRARAFNSEPPALAWSMVPTQFVSMDELADEWDRLVLLNEQAEAVRAALQLLAPEFENISFVRLDSEGGFPGTRSRHRRTAMVKLKGVVRPVPLNSMGDGMLRVLQLALKLFGAKGGFLLIDEFENGLHYSVQERIWDWLFEMAEVHNVQIFATTHSWDCIESFTEVAVKKAYTEGVLLRLGHSVRDSDKGQVIATVFDEDALYNVTQADVDIR